MDKLLRVQGILDLLPVSGRRNVMLLAQAMADIEALIGEQSERQGECACNRQDGCHGSCSKEETDGD